MALKRTANKRKRTSNNLTRNRTTPPAYKNASQPEQDHSPASETFWAATRILQDNGTHYLVEWDGIDPATSSPYEPTWEPHDFVTPALEAEWKETMAAQSAMARHTQSQAQSYWEGGDRARSTHESPEPLLPAHCLTEKVHQCQSASTAFPQQMRQSRCDSSSLFVGSQESECEFENSGLRSCGVVLASQSNNGSASYTTTTSKEVSVSNQHKSATVNGAGDTDEENLSATDPAALVLQHSSHTLPPAPIKRADSVGTTQQLLRLELTEKVQEEGGQESKSPESLAQEELESLEQGGQEPLKGHTRILEVNELLSPALPATEKSSKVEKQQDMHSEPEIRGTSPSVLARETIDGQLESPVEVELVFQTRTRRQTDLKEAVLGLPSRETFQEQGPAPVSLEQPPEGLFEEDVIRHAPASPNVCESSDGPKRLLAPSEQSISPYPEQGGLTKQHIIDTLPDSSINNSRTELSATPSKLISMLEPRIAGEQTFTKQIVTASARGENVEACLLLASTPTEWAADISEQVGHHGTEAGRFPPPSTLNQSVRSLEMIPVQEAQHFIRDSIHTIYGEPTASTGHGPFTQKPPNRGETGRESALRQSENGCRTINHSVSPAIDSVHMSLNSPSRRVRSTLYECNQSPEELAVALRPLLEPSAPVSCGGSPICQKRLQSVELVQQCMLPPIDHPGPNRRWTIESRELSHSDDQRLQHRDPHPIERFHSNTTQVVGLYATMSSISESNGVEGASTTELTRAAVQVEPKKRKRQFMKRTKTGCGTCRRRKKKCDEAKPECNNCKRSGFICEGYANKAPWPKDGVAKPLPLLQAQERMVSDAHPLHSRLQSSSLAHIPNCESSVSSSQGTHRNFHASIRSVGAYDQPITIEECEPQPLASNRDTGQGKPFRVLYPPEQPMPPVSYPQPARVHERDASHYHYRGTHPIQYLPPLCRSHRVYDHDPQSMSQVTTNLSVVASEAHQRTEQPSRHPSMVTPTAALPGPPPSCQKPVRSLQKTEKQKMLDGEPFMPYNTQLNDERTQCAGALYRFNNGSNAIIEVAQSIHEPSFQRIIEVRGTQRHHEESPFGGYLGNGAHVATPFHCDYGYNVSIGDNVTIGPGCQLLDSARITIGRNTTIGARVTITTLSIPTNTKALEARNNTEVAKEVHIGENVHIGSGCTVEAGVRIGHGAIVLSGSVVVYDIPPGYIARGNPTNMHKAN
ncbi:hypothetical protein GQ44DRAFT_725910 [Phaeosphaeriaceae sp. PMI808]|nr:hypothetical protein GQ44DRAFT_725910 [Phaeosphaeriaceae sp. PMI808]